MKFAIVPAALVVLLTAAGCSSGIKASEGTASAAPAAASSSAAAPAPETPAPAYSEPAAESALMVKFGSPIKYEDGVTVTVRHTGTATAGPYAAPAAARSQAVELFEITLVNGTKTTFDPSMFNWSAVIGTAGKKAEKVFDTNFSTDYFDGVIVPKGTQTIQMALLIPKKDLPTTVFTVSPSFEHADAVVTGGL